MRLSYLEEDQAFLKEQERLTQKMNEQKKYSKEILDDNFDENMADYAHKRKP